MTFHVLPLTIHVQHRFIIFRHKIALQFVVCYINKKKLHYNIYITNVETDILSASEIRKTYYLRWQIALALKTWRSFFRINEVKRVKKERLECPLLGRLLWILINWNLFSRLNKHVSAKYVVVFKRSLKFASTLKIVLLKNYQLKPGYPISICL